MMEPLGGTRTGEERGAHPFLLLLAGARLEASSRSLLPFLVLASLVSLAGLALGASLGAGEGRHLQGSLRGAVLGARWSGVVLITLLLPTWICESLWLRREDGTLPLLATTPTSRISWAVGLLLSLLLRAYGGLIPALVPGLWLHLMAPGGASLGGSFWPLYLPLSLGGITLLLAWFLSSFHLTLFLSLTAGGGILLVMGGGGS